MYHCEVGCWWGSGGVLYYPFSFAVNWKLHSRPENYIQEMLPEIEGHFKCQWGRHGNHKCLCNKRASKYVMEEVMELKGEINILSVTDNISKEKIWFNLIDIYRRL